MMLSNQETIEFQKKRLHQIKWRMFGGASVLVFLVIVFNYFFFGMPLYKGIVNGLLGIGIAYLAIFLAFKYVGQLRLQLFEALESQKAAETEVGPWSRRRMRL